MYFNQLRVCGEDFVGLLGFASDKYAILSENFPDKDVLGVPSLKTRIYGTGLVGLFLAGNSNGVLLPYLISEKKEEELRGFLGKLGVDLAVLGGKHTALGNLVAANDHGAVVSPRIAEVRAIEKALNVPAVKMEVGGHEDVGAILCTTNKGFVAHPDAEKELGKLEEIFKVKGMCSTVNFGFPFVKSGIIANSNGYITGLKTSGIELGRLDDALGFF